MIKRYLEKAIRSKIGKGKAVILYGPRQVGKTTLLKTIYGNEDDVLWLNGDEEMIRAVFENFSVEAAKQIIGNSKVVIIDEAQKISDIGNKLKIIQDGFGDRIQLIATGSSSFELANKINEPLTGRKWEFWMYPISVNELMEHHDFIKEKQNLENRLLYGSYPDIVEHPEDAIDRIKELASDNLYKDVLNLGEIIKTDKLAKILQALAFQVGSQVSINELAGLIGLDNKTIDKYIGLLEKSFIIFRLTSFSSNLRNELKSSQKFFFYDVGIRNAVINDFRPINMRNDVGQIFENYIIAELRKYNDNRSYFWRTSRQQEIDYVEERTGEIVAAEIKWNDKRKVKLPSVFVEKYKPSVIDVINRENYIEKLTRKTSNQA